MPVEWSEDLATGIEIIDSQHKELLYRINSLMEAISQRKGREETREITGFLDDYLQLHFKTEEDAMLKHSYPDYDRHKEAHDHYRFLFKEFKSNYDASPGPHHTVLLTNMVMDLVHNHIRKTDKALAAFLRSIGKNKHMGGPIEGAELF